MYVRTMSLRLHVLEELKRHHETTLTGRALKRHLHRLETHTDDQLLSTYLNLGLDTPRKDDCELTKECKSKVRMLRPTKEGHGPYPSRG